MSATFHISDAVLDELYAHARAGHPEEVCGLLLGDAARPESADEARRCDNLANAMHARDPASFPRTARAAYVIGGADIALLERSQGGARPVRVIYHSHCDVGSYFSDEDKRIACPPEWGEPLYAVDYLVIDARADGCRGARLFRFREGDYVEIARWGQPEDLRPARP